MADSRHAGDSDDDRRDSRTSTRYLPVLSSRHEWSNWSFKAKSFFAAKHIRLDATLPLQDNRLVRRTAEEQTQDEIDYRWLLHQYEEDFAWGVAEQAAGRDYELRVPLPIREPVEAPETAEHYEERVATFVGDSATIFQELVGSMKGEALTIIKGLDQHGEDGRQAYLELEKRLGEKGTSPMFLLLRELLSIKQGPTSITSHVAKFETMIQDCNGLNIAMSDEVFTVIFLQSLNGTFKTFVQVTLLNTSDVKIRCSQVMANAENHARTHGSDEANHSGAALDATEMCKFGAGCNKWRAGTCTMNHPAPKKKNGGGGGGGGGQGEREGSWTCGSCSAFNFPHRQTCFKRDCNQAKPNGSQGQKRKSSYGNKENAKIAKERKALAQKVTEMTKQMKAAKAAVESSGVDVDLGFTATERFGGHDVCDDVMDEADYVQEPPIKFKCDSGASSHFANFELPVTEEKKYSGIADIADGTSLRVTKRAKFQGVTTDGDPMDLDVKLSSHFDQNLFSIKKACEAGKRAVFDSAGSYLQDKASGDKIPMIPTGSGWDLLFQSKTGDNT